jgi:hypothetical protein
MKALITTITLATFIATPVLAQTKQRHLPSQLSQTKSGNSRWDVYVGGKHIGRDPDAFIRSQLMSDPMQGGNDAGGGGGE